MKPDQPGPPRRSTLLAALTAAAGSLASAGCAGDEANNGVQIEQLGDTTVVTTALAVSVPTYLVDSVEILWRSDSLQFPIGITGVADRLVVGDLFRIHYLTLDGEYLQTVGRRGEGPGEFAGIRGIGRAGDTVLVFDAAQFRVSLLDPEGQLLEDHRQEPHTSFPSNNPYFRRISIYDGGVLQLMMPGITSVNVATNTALVWHDLRSDSVRVIGEWFLFEIRQEGGRAYESDPLGPRAKLALGLDGRWAYGDGQAYCITLARVNETAATRACREWDRAEVPGSVRNPDWDDIQARSSINSRRMEGLKEAFASQDLGDVFPSYDWLWFSEAGDLWVRTIGPDRATQHPSLSEQFPELRPPYYSWDVFGEDGQLRMTVRLPSHFDPQVILEDRAYGFNVMPAGDHAVAVAVWQEQPS